MITRVIVDIGGWGGKKLVYYFENEKLANTFCSMIKKSMSGLSVKIEPATLFDIIQEAQ